MWIETIGLLASCMAVVMFVSPLDQIRNIVKIKKSDEISPVLYVAMVLNCSLWTVYGLGISNWFIVMPNAIGVVLGMVTLGFIFHYR